MALSMAHLLIHSEGIPAHARNELRRAIAADPKQRTKHLEAAAQSIRRQTDLKCGEILDLLRLA